METTTAAAAAVGVCQVLPGKSLYRQEVMCIRLQAAPFCLYYSTEFIHLAMSLASCPHTLCHCHQIYFFKLPISLKMNSEIKLVT